MPDTLTMQQVADLAGVRRAVVSMWRSRYPTTEGGFPAPVDARSLTFRADAVGEWLTRTGRGNNPDAAVDAALHSSRFATIREHLDAASSLLLLQALTGGLLADLDAETALDAILDAQLAALLPPRETLAALDDAALVADVDTLAEAGYGGERVLWRLVAAEHAPGGAFAEHSLTVDAAAMFTSLLRAVATADHHVVPHGESALALLTQVAADIPADGTSFGGQGAMPLNAGMSVREKDAEVPPARASAASRLALRAFAARGIETTGTDAGDNLHVIVENRADAHAVITLFEKVRAVSHDLADRDRALVLAPADILVGALDENSHLDEARRTCFNISEAQGAVRRHRQQQRAGLAPDYTLPLRYVATLPKGMLRAAGRRRLALWALAPSVDETRVAFTAYGDHANHALDPGECDALAADVAAACSGDRATHAFLRARHRATYNLLDEPSLVIPPGVREPRDGGEVLAQAWGHESRAGAPLASEVDLVSAGLVAARAPKTWADVVSTWASVRRGHRVPDEITSATRGALVDVIGSDEVRGLRSVGSRRVDRLEIERVVPQVRYTEPGDVVFVAVERPAAIVDERGGRVVQAPARILRPRGGSVEGLRLIPAQAALDINAQRGVDTAGWHLHLTPAEQADAAQRIATSVAARRRALRDQLAALDAYESTVLTGIAEGVLRAEAVNPRPMHDMQEEGVSTGVPDDVTQ
ncbi:hypothetical protein [Dermacoccus nishinomiyaensis]